MMTERLEVLQPLRIHAVKPLQRAAGAGMQLHATTHKQVLVEHILEH